MQGGRYIDDVKLLSYSERPVKSFKEPMTFSIFPSSRAAARSTSRKIHRLDALDLNKPINRVIFSNGNVKRKPIVFGSNGCNQR